jgi:hypothetical protein
MESAVRSSGAVRAAMIDEAANGSDGEGLVARVFAALEPLER